MQSFLRRLAGFSVGSLVSAVLSVIQVPIVTHFMATADYGLFSFYRSILLQIPVFLCIGLDQAYVREYHEAKDKAAVFRLAYLVPLGISLLFFLGLALFAPQVSNWLFHRTDETRFVIWGGLWCVFGVLERFLFLSVRMEEKALFYSQMAIAIKVAVFGLTMALLLAGFRSYDGPLYGLLIGNVAVDVLFAIRFRHLLRYQGFAFDRELFARMFRYGLPLVLVVGLSAILSTLDNLSLKQFATSEDLGVYNAALAIVSLFSLVTTTFSNFWVPTALRWHETQRSTAHFAFVSDALLLLLTLIFFFVQAFSPLVPYFLGPGYSAAALILGLLSIRPILSVLSETTMLGIVFARRSQYNLWISLITFVPSLLLNIFLTPRIGFRGAALAAALSYVFYYASRTYFSRRSGFRLRQTKPVLVIPVLLLAGTLQALRLLPLGIIIAGGLLLSIYFQRSTIQTALDIRRNPSQWNFS